MSNSKKGFTLVEVLVVILVSTLVITMVGGTMVFLTTASENMINEAEEIDMAKNIERYIRTIAKENQDNFTVILNNNNIENNGNIIFYDTGLSLLEFKNENDFIKCYIKFQSGREFDFIIGE